MHRDSFYMQKVLELARGAMLRNEVPVGALLVANEEIVAMSFNTREANPNPLGHAEAEVIQKASEKLQTWRLDKTTLYVSLEPCLLCTGLIFAARVPRVVFASKNPKGGSLLYIQERRHELNLNHSVDVVSGIMAEESSVLLKGFFQDRRTEHRIKKSGVA